jgi:alkyldihydroxyacetonephosphate synthase
MTPLVRDLALALPGLRASDDEADRVAYARDLWPRHHLAVREGRPAEHKPGAVVWPASTDEVARLVRWARDRGTALVPFGAGSGVCGGVLPRHDVVVVDLKRMGRIRALDARAPLVEVEAGHMGLALEQALARAGVTLGHFPSSILCSTVGGWVAARSAGQCSGAYGKIEDMVIALECVTGGGEVVALRRRTSQPDLVPLVVGSEGTLAIVTSATLRVHPAPAERAFGAWSLPATERGWEAMRAIFQAGLRPAVARLYDPFDAMLARRGRGRAPAGDRAAPARPSRIVPGLGGAVLRSLLKRPAAMNELLHARVASRALGGAMLVVIFESATAGASERGMDEARGIVGGAGGRWLGDGPARDWFARRYAVSYRQAPVFAKGAFVDTMEVAARWSKLGDVYEAVRRALGPSVLVMAHFGHAYPDGCCIYFSFVGTADPQLARTLGWDAACEATYDRAWREALAAALCAGGTLAHHHGVGRSKAPRMPRALGAGVEVVRALMRAFDPAGILNPGNLIPAAATPTATATATPTPTATATAVLALDDVSLVACLDGEGELLSAERRLRDVGLTLDVGAPAEGVRVADWLAEGAPGSRDRWLDPVDQLVAGFDATLVDGTPVSLPPAPRRAVGPDISALFVGARGRFGRIDRAWLRVHRRGVARPTAPAFDHERDPAPTAGEVALLEAIARTLRTGA